MKRRNLLVAASLVFVSRSAAAFPDQPVRIVVPFTPAGGPDMIARFLAEGLPARLGQSAVVENIPGASGNIGSNVVAKAKPDGHTLMLSVNTLVMNASLFRNLPYDPVRDFVLIPDRGVLSRRPSSIVGALLRGRAAVAADFEREFRPILLTSTTGRS